MDAGAFHVRRRFLPQSPIYLALHHVRNYSCTPTRTVSTTAPHLRVNHCEATTLSQPARPRTPARLQASPSRCRRKFGAGSQPLLFVQRLSCPTPDRDRRRLVERGHGVNCTCNPPSAYLEPSFRRLRSIAYNDTKPALPRCRQGSVDSSGRRTYIHHASASNLVAYRRSADPRQGNLFQVCPCILFLPKFLVIDFRSTRLSGAVLSLPLRLLPFLNLLSAFRITSIPRCSTGSPASISNLIIINAIRMGSSSPRLFYPRSSPISRSTSTTASTDNYHALCLETQSCEGAIG